jgi:hypothetical protein
VWSRFGGAWGHAALGGLFMFAMALFVFTLYVRRPTWGDFENDAIWHLRSTERFQREVEAADLSGHSTDLACT